MSLTIGDVVRAIEERYPAHRAEAWDRAGLLVGDAAEPLTGVALSLDPSAAAIAAAREAGANLLLTHHPAFLKSPDPITAGPGARGIAYFAAREGVALACAHTNLDRDPRAQETLPDALGLTVLEPLERSSLSMTQITTFVPANSAQAVISAMMSAGAGRVGEYEGASFAAEGEGRFTPGSLAHPVAGTTGEPTTTPETRLETVCDPALAGSVLAATRSAHPYEEPLIIAADVAIARGEHRLGRISEPARPTTLGELVSHAAAVFGVSPRVWGDPATPVTRVATATGSGGSLIGDAIASGCDAFVAGEVRYHDATEAVAAGLAVVEIGHDASEWPLVEVLRDTVLAMPGIDPTRVVVLPKRLGWWVPEKRDAL